MGMVNPPRMDSMGMAICGQGGLSRCGNVPPRWLELSCEWLFVAKDVLCMGVNGLCGSKQVVDYIKGRKGK